MSKCYVYIGTWSSRVNTVKIPLPEVKGAPLIDGGDVYAYSFDYETGKLSFINRAKSIDAGMICVSPDHKNVYATNECSDFAGWPASGGGVTAFSIDPQTGALSSINSNLSYGARPTYITTDKNGEFILVANHGAQSMVCNFTEDGKGGWVEAPKCDDGSIAVFRRKKDGAVGELTDLKIFQGHGHYWSYGQAGPHAHSVNIDEDNFVIACDKGTDHVYLYKLDTATGKLNQLQDYAYKPGTSPRHLAFHPTMPFFYVTNEIVSSVTVYSIDRNAGRISALQEISSVPDDFMDGHAQEYPSSDISKTDVPPNRRPGGNAACDIRVHPNGKFVYSSNRFGYDSIACYRIDDRTGLLSLIDIKKMDGIDPRGFYFDPTGEYMLVGLMHDSKVEVFKVDGETGLLSATGEYAQIPLPCSVRFVPT